MIYLFVILVILIFVFGLFFLKSDMEGFVDPYSLKLHREISEKELLWNLAHANKLYYYQDQVPQY